MVGYAVAEKPFDGGVAVFFGGGKLARDLSLPALRERWRDGEAECQEAAAEWAGEAPATGVHEAPRASRHLTYRWAEARERWGKTSPREERRASAPHYPGGGRAATQGLGEVVRELGKSPPRTWPPGEQSPPTRRACWLSYRGDWSVPPGRWPAPRAYWLARPKGLGKGQPRPAVSRAAA